jgi:hypothetical protein
MPKPKVTEVEEASLDRTWGEEHGNKPSTNEKIP